MGLDPSPPPLLESVRMSHYIIFSFFLVSTLHYDAYPLQSCPYECARVASRICAACSRVSEFLTIFFFGIHITLWRLPSTILPLQKHTWGVGCRSIGTMKAVRQYTRPRSLLLASRFLTCVPYYSVCVFLQTPPTAGKVSDILILGACCRVSKLLTHTVMFCMCLLKPYTIIAVRWYTRPQNLL